jgi:hypothetical protein
MGPVVVGGTGGNAQNFGGFLKGHPDEITELHQIGFELVLDGKFVERLVHGEQFVVVTQRGWTLDVLYTIRRLEKADFATADAYAYPMLRQTIAYPHVPKLHAGLFIVCSRKKKFPVGDVMVMLFVPLFRHTAAGRLDRRFGQMLERRADMRGQT